MRSLLIALVFTLVMLQWSFDRFRLTSPPFLDDVYWMNEGIAMLDSMHDGGISGLMHYFAASKTLAPYSMVGAAGFAMFGIEDWAPYAMNGWLILCLLIFLDIARVRERLPMWTWFIAAGLALAFPICGFSVVSFLGDNASGLFIAMGSIAFLAGWPSSESPLESWAGTAAWVLAFYGKSTLFPETMLLFCATAVIGCRLSNRELRKWAVRTGMVLLLILPYYALVAGDLFRYFYTQNFGAFRGLWAFKGTNRAALLYYVTGFSGETMLGPALYLALALLIVRAALLFGASVVERLRFAALAIVIAAAYALPTWAANKTTTVGAPFQFLVVLASVESLYAVLRRFPRWRGAIGILVAGAALLVFRFPQPLDWRGSPAVVARNRAMNQLMAALEAQHLKRDEPVFITTTGYVSVNTLKYQFLKRRLPVPRFFELALSGDASEFPPMIDQAAFVIATEPGNDEVFYVAPSAQIQAATLALVRQNASLVEIAKFRTWRGKHYYLFGRRGRLSSAVPEVPEADEPEPLPEERPRSGREFEIEFPAPRGLYAELKVHLFVPHGPVTVRADIPREGGHPETYAQGGSYEFTYRYAIQQHLVSTVRVRFRMDPDAGVVVGPVELTPLPNPERQ